VNKGQDKIAKEGGRKDDRRIKKVKLPSPSSYTHHVTGAMTSTHVPPCKRQKRNPYTDTLVWGNLSFP
jgi:hypothetical protein